MSGSSALRSDDRPVVLVTGCSSGIGRAAALLLSASGWRVIATMRNPDGAADGGLSRGAALRAMAEEAGVALDVRALDVADDESVASALSGVIHDYHRLDAVINNAGAGHVGTVETDTLDEFRAVFESNLFGVVRVTRAAMPHLRASRGRLVTVTSVGGVVGQPFNEAYCAAKFAVEGMMESLAPVAAAQGVRVSVVEPGAVATEFVASVGVDDARARVEGTPYAATFERYISRTASAFAGAQSPDAVAEVLRDVLAAEQPDFRYQTSPSSAAFAGLKLADRTGAAVQALTATWLS